MGRVRVEFNGSIKREIVHDFTVDVIVFDSYDSKLPTADAKTNDVGLGLTTGWTFEWVSAASNAPEFPLWRYLR